MSKTYQFTLVVVADGDNEQDAWENAKQSLEEKIADDSYDAAEELD